MQGFQLLFCEWLASNKHWGSGGCAPENVAKLKPFWCVFHDFWPINLRYRLDLNDNALFTLAKSNWNRLKQLILNVSVMLTLRWLSLIILQRWSNADLSGHPRGSITVRYGCAYLYPQSSFIHVSGEITPVCLVFQNMVCACLVANESSRMAVYTT